MRTAEEIEVQVRAAFEHEPARDLLLNNHCCECLETAEAFANKSWTNISLELLLKGRETALLTPQAWRYYLPAVITWCLRVPDSVDVINDNVVYQLEPPSDSDKPSLHQWFQQRAHGFTKSQCEAIVEYLDWYRERDEVEWKSYDTEPPSHVYRALEYWRRAAAGAE